MATNQVRSSFPAYEPQAFAPFAVTVDLAVFTIRDGQLSVLLVERGEPPFEGAWALPGGFVRPDEDISETANRELAEETGLGHFDGHLEQLRTYGSPQRDPRMRVVSIAYVAFAPDLPEPVAGTDARRARWWVLDDLDLADQQAAGRRRRAPRERGLPLAFDHAAILTDAVDRVSAKIEYTPLAAAFCPREFTLGELQHVYEAVWGVPVADRANFRRKVLNAPGFVVPVDDDAQRLTGGQGRPAQLFRSGDTAELNPPIKRPVGARGAPLAPTRGRTAAGRGP